MPRPITGNVVMLAQLVRNHCLVSLLTALFLVGCASNDVRRGFADVEQALGTDTKTTVQLHEAGYFPWSVRLNHPGLIVGIEKSPRETVAPENGIQTLYDGSAGQGLREKVDLLHNNPKMLFLSQLYEYGGRYEDPACAHYSVYEANSNQSFIGPCNGEHRGAHIDDAGRMPGAFQGSVEAVQVLRQRVQEWIDIEEEADDPFTHVLMIVMGWNTSQLEAYRNFNSIVGNMKATHQGDRFKPLVIGVTWPSFWENDWLDPLVRGLSYRNKANDADELGLSWVGLIAREVLADVDTEDIETVLIGHSFGARAVATATCAGPVIAGNGVGDPGQQDAWSIDTVVALQPAFSINRFYSQDDGDWFNEEIHFPAGCRHARNVVMTASRHDTAVDMQFIADMIGDVEQYKDHCLHTDNPDFHCGTMLADDLVGRRAGKRFDRILYVNASDSIRLNSPRTGGGGHSDIYREASGRMIWSFLRAVDEDHLGMECRPVGAGTRAESERQGGA
ncbi:hypothetical protein [Tamilnaduibacter salinus]|uniref:hypothetical protein n=1 Tax=Tamilnaduibacter salinus TaxID=1484056 RepID=UPI00117C5A45|nr:hypothetical protein [Tamilnaduibacter salinus]